MDKLPRTNSQSQQFYISNIHHFYVCQSPQWVYHPFRTIIVSPFVNSSAYLSATRLWSTWNIFVSVPTDLPGYLLLPIFFFFLALPLEPDAITAHTTVFSQKKRQTATHLLPISAPDFFILSSFFSSVDAKIWYVIRSVANSYILGISQCIRTTSINISAWSTNYSVYLQCTSFLLS